MQHPVSAPIGVTVPNYADRIGFAQLTRRAFEGGDLHPLRDQWAQLKVRRRDLDKLQSTNAPELEKKKQEFDTWYAGFPQRVQDLVAKGRAIEDEIYQANQPKPHKYELVAAQ